MRHPELDSGSGLDLSLDLFSKKRHRFRQASPDLSRCHLNLFQGLSYTYPQLLKNKNQIALTIWPSKGKPPFTFKYCILKFLLRVPPKLKFLVPACGMFYFRAIPDRCVPFLFQILCDIRLSRAAFHL